MTLEEAEWLLEITPTTDEYIEVVGLPGDFPRDATLIERVRRVNVDDIINNRQYYLIPVGHLKDHVKDAKKAAWDKHVAEMKAKHGNKSQSAL